jgi:hypothetical protein
VQLSAHPTVRPPTHVPRAQGGTRSMEWTVPSRRGRRRAHCASSKLQGWHRRRLPCARRAAFACGSCVDRRTDWRKANMRDGARPEDTRGAARVGTSREPGSIAARQLDAMRWRAGSRRGCERMRHAEPGAGAAGATIRITTDTMSPAAAAGRGNGSFHGPRAALSERLRLLPARHRATPICYAAMAAYPPDFFAS